MSQSDSEQPKVEQEEEEPEAVEKKVLGELGSVSFIHKTMF